jgi:DNA-binding transcriptional ArsR family regulator
MLYINYKYYETVFKQGIMEQEMSIEKMALIAKSIGNELRFKLYQILIENMDKDIQVFELSKMVDGSYRNVQIHLQFLADSGLVNINSESYPATVRILKSVHFFEKRVMEAKEEGIGTLMIHESQVLYSTGIGGYDKIADEGEIVRIARSLSHPTRIYIMQLLYNHPGSNIPQVEKLLRGTRYESSYRNVSQHIDKLVEAGIARAVKDQFEREKLVYPEKIIKIETQDIKS